MNKKVLSYIKDNKLIKNGDKILVAFSGGPDSLCLLNILIELKNKLNIKIGAAHLNHLLRGKDAFKDEEFVKNICEENDIPCYIKRVDINKYAKEYRLSSEMAGRNARYDFFQEILDSKDFNKIATAHNANDQAETILFRLIRGTGLEGLGGIKVCRENKIIRPILCLSRKEVEQYILDKKLNPRIDKTNFEKIYNRNKIRLDIIPYIKQNFNEDIVQTLNRMSLLIQKDNAFIERIALKAYNKYCNRIDGDFLLNKELFSEEDSIITRVVRKALVEISESCYDFEMKHIYDILELFKKETGKVIDLPKSICAENIYGDIKLRKNLKNRVISIKNEIKLNKNDLQNKIIEFNGYNIKMSILANTSSDELNLNESNLIKYFNFDKIDSIISVRTRLVGDKFMPLGMKGKKKIKDIFIDMKIPKEDRDNIPLICFDNNIAWIATLRVAENYKVTKNTKNILKIVVERKE
ncbi:tRNA lysidine(34) synthetase TilS [Clostridium weizhouense]|uniref:tRNA(Ile)-lysidine synthase n=1 Tax=Clostridium weizhouense TaxID=2859781 RepID=A0ABS7ARH3_9CLOT|nr:tRNA lysidine(34) synthetase TilS [Clostridium weizhouense]MBW6411154.1 tRNA lysidine(34) synthetase TilS [Clostridium weizhouense]